MMRNLRCVIALVTMVLLAGGTVVAQATFPLTVYFTFSTPTSFHLLPVAVALPGQATPQQALELLILGPPDGSGLERNLPADTEILDVRVQEGVAYVDFSENIRAGAAGSSGEALLIGAVTNTLCRLDGIEKVQFLIEGQMVESLGGHFEAKEPFAPQWGMVLSSPFTDVEGHWAEGNVHAFFLTGLLAGYGDGTFRPQQPITRAEFIKLLVLAKTEVSEHPQMTTFTDVTSEHWAHRYIESAVQQGILRIEDYGERLHPSAALSRREMAVLLTRANDLEAQAHVMRDTVLPYTDTALLPGWARGYVAVVTELGLMQGDDTGAFRPESTATRAEATAVLTRQLGVGEENVRLVWPACQATTQHWVLLGGVARAFEGTVNGRIRDETDRVWAQTFTTATQGGPGWGYWAILLPVPSRGDDATYHIEAFTISAKDGEMQDVVSRPLTSLTR